MGEEVNFFLRCVSLFAFFSVGCYAGALIYAHRVRICLALDVLRGRVKHDGGNFSCAREHIEGSYRAVKREEYDTLVAAADELKVARGFIAAFERDKVSYAEIVNDVLAPSLRIEKK